MTADVILWLTFGACSAVLLFVAWLGRPSLSPKPRRWVLSGEDALVNLDYVRYVVVMDVKAANDTVVGARVVVGWGRTPGIDTVSATSLYTGSHADCLRVQKDLARRLGAIAL